jgi:SAM-dependent methyltransferase
MTATQTDGGQLELWNGSAGRAWADGQVLLDRLYQPFEDRLVEALPAGQGGVVLDVGCGAGATTLAALRRLGPGARALGVDISEPLVAAASARAAREGLAATFVRDDAQSHPFEPGQADYVQSRFGVMFFADPPAAFANIRRAAKPGGRLRVIAWRSAAENAFMVTAERAAAPFLDLPPRKADGPGQFAFADRDRVQGMLDASGWTGTTIAPIDVPCAMSTADFETYVGTLGPVGLALREKDDRTREQVLPVVRAAFAPFVDGAQVRFTGACWLIEARA